MDYEGEGDLDHPGLDKHNQSAYIPNLSFQNTRKEITFCKLSLLPNGECKGELLRVYVLGLFASDGIPSLLDSVLHFRLWLRDINAFKPLNHTSASSLSLQI